MGNIESIMRSTQTAKESYNSQRVTPDSKYSYMGELYKIRQANKALSSAYTRLKAEEIELRKTYNKNVVGEKLAENQKAFEVQVRTNRERLLKSMVEVSEAKRNAVQDFVIIAPPEDVVKLLDNIQSRINAGGKIGDTEWNMIVRRVSDSGNYQALERLNAMAISIKRDFSLPFEVDDMMTDIDNVEKMLVSIIEKIETPESEWDYWQMAFLSEKNYDQVKILEKLDSMLGASVPEKQETWRERLMRSAQKALDAGDFDLFHETYGFISNNRDQLMTAEEVKQDVLNRAEELYNRGMTAGEK